MKASRQATREGTTLFRACLVKGSLDEGRVRQAVQQLITARPRGFMATLAVLQRLVKLECDRRTAKIETAQLLPPDLVGEVLKSLEGAYGPGLTASFAENPALIGGMRIQVGSDVFDGSVRGRLAALERNL